MFKFIIKTILVTCVGIGALFLIQSSFPQANQVAFSFLNIPFAYVFLITLILMGMAVKWIKVK